MKIEEYIEQMEETHTLALRLSSQMREFNINRGLDEVEDLKTWLSGYISALYHVKEYTSESLEV